ncbi:hypothetical protein MATL_G00175320 [Megalops atlanticus]|uniref:Ig-like domain-containing protein n=1 Tax=Megalops atlanticus TaxID=7932 RepID=A0A9D3PTY1_MEGAT|nr:hypothetical protein MATL_G00175320 [Megalops atlanticus]
MIILCVAVALLNGVYAVQSDVVLQPIPLMTARAGDRVILECFQTEGNADFVSWFKKTVGQRPRIIATSTPYAYAVFHNEFNATRFAVTPGKREHHLSISGTSDADSATYYCAAVWNYEIFFGNGTYLMIKGSEQQKSNSRTVVQQPVSEPLQPGDSVTLQCTIHTETCAGEHSVYWFRQSSGESSPGIIYTHGNRGDHCERSSGAGSPTQSCVYKLPKRNLSFSDAGTYYCAVATCGEILFGNGTRLDVQEGVNHIVFGLGGTLVLCVVGIIALVCTRNRAKCCEHCPVLSGRASQPLHHDGSRAEPTGAQSDGEVLNYAALSFADKKSRGGRKKQELKQESVYADVRHPDWE